MDKVQSVLEHPLTAGVAWAAAGTSIAFLNGAQPRDIGYNWGTGFLVSCLGMIIQKQTPDPYKSMVSLAGISITSQFFYNCFRRWQWKRGLRRPEVLNDIIDEVGAHPLFGSSVAMV